jgi:hypothetical protein
LRVQRLPALTGDVAAFCAGLPGPVRVAYEAGPTGFGLARMLQRQGVGCVLAAPGNIARTFAAAKLCSLCLHSPTTRSTTVRHAEVCDDCNQPGQGVSRRGRFLHQVTAVEVPNA